MGFSFGEAAYAPQRVLSWQTTVVGDPLYHPLGKPIQWLQEELTQAHSTKLGWLRVLATNQALQQGTERATLIQLLEKETLSQTHPAVCEKLADLYLSVNRTEEARASYERALLLKPSRDQQNRLLLNLAQLDQQAGDWKGALDRMETLLEKDTTFPQKKMMLTRMKLVAEQADLPEAVLAIEQQLTITP